MNMPLAELQQEIAKARKQLKKYQTKASSSRVRYEEAERLYHQYETNVYAPLIEELARRDKEYSRQI